MNTSKQKKFFTIGRSIALAAALLLSISALLPWGHGKSGFVTGMDGDGIIVVSIGILAFFLLFIKKIPIVISLIIGVTGFIIGVTVYQGMNVVIKTINGQIGSGIYLTIFASILLVLGILVEITEEHKKRKLNLYYIDEVLQGR